MLGRFFFDDTSDMELNSRKVYLQKCSDYREQNLMTCFESTLSQCLQTHNFTSSKVLLKPNLITARMGTLACTESKFILAAVKWFLDHGAQVSIGDSPAFGTTTSVLHKLGVLADLRNLAVTVINFKKSRYVTLPSGIKAGIATDALECDFLVNMPRVKAHAQLRVSLAVKNLFGCLVGMQKPIWHMRYGGCEGHFADHLAELLMFLPQGVTLVDGVVAMHNTGPVAGQPFPLRMVCCATNPVAVDRALLSVLGIKPELSPLMISCEQKNLPGTDVNLLEFPILSPEELAVDFFVVPAELYSIRFNPFRFLKGSIRRVLLKIGLPL